MKLHEIKILNEMGTKLLPQETGIATTIWIGKIGGQHAARIKASNIRNTFKDSDNFSVSIEKEPQLKTDKITMKLKTDDLNDVKDWIKTNYDDLMLIWKIYETGDIEVEDKDGEIVTLDILVKRLKRI